jgi:Phytanoyl-CoA dioxygenase (PhyH)
MLSEQQIAHFQLFGYLMLPKFFGPDELHTIEDEYERGIAAASPAYATALGVRGQISWSNMREDTPTLGNMLENERLAAVAESLMGEGAFGVMSNGNHFTGALTEWHADTSITAFSSVKFVAYLEDLGADNGALRVIPGSHRSPWHDELRALGSKTAATSPGNPDDTVAKTARFEVTDVPAQVCASRPGDLLAFDLRTWHASWNGVAGRRMCSFTYFKEPETAAEQEGMLAMAAQLRRESAFRELRRQREWLKRGTNPTEVPRPASQFSARWLENDVQSERRRRWIESLLRWGILGGQAAETARAKDAVTAMSSHADGR